MLAGWARCTWRSASPTASRWRSRSCCPASRSTNSPAIDSGAVGGTFFVALEYCGDRSLSDLQKRRGGRLTLAEAGPLMMDARAGLAHAHRNGFVHRDIKPPNILLAPAGRRTVAKVADMGLSKSFPRAGLSGMTATGGYAGSYPFMPVEQMTNFKFTKPVSDVWSLGATFVHVLTGQFPREEKPGQDPVAAILKGRIAPVRRYAPDLPLPARYLRVVCCMAAGCARRPGTHHAWSHLAARAAAVRSRDDRCTSSPTLRRAGCGKLAAALTKLRTNQYARVALPKAPQRGCGRT